MSSYVLTEFVKIASAQQVKRSGKSSQHLLHLTKSMIKNSFHLSELYMHAVILFWPGGFDVNFSSKNLKTKIGVK